MNIWRLIKRNLLFHRRTHLGAALGAAISTAVLTGALIVGDSVEGSLNDLALTRLGNTETALELRNRFFRSDLAGNLSRELGSPAAPVLLLNGTLFDPDGNAPRCRVKVLGVDDRFRGLGAGKAAICTGDDAAICQALADRLDLGPGDEVVLRFEKPGPFPREAPLSLDHDLSVARRLRVRCLVPDDAMGRFSLAANQIPPLNVFVSLTELGRWTDLAERANMLLVARTSPEGVAFEKARDALKRSIRLADLGLDLRKVPGSGRLELVSNRVFLDEEIGRAAASAGRGASGILTTFVNELALEERRTPYSFVAAVGPLTPDGGEGSLIPGEIGRSDMVINQWLADDLGADEGDEVTLTYFVPAPGRRMEERKSRFRVSSVVPLEGAAADRTLMPDYPGLAEGEKCSDWDPGIDIDLSMIRAEDEEYWARHRGTPKAFVALDAGQALWGNRFGSLTAVRFPASSEKSVTIGERIMADLDLASLGFFFKPVRREALAAVDQSLDLGPLFLGLSFVLIAAALIVMGLSFSLAVEQRSVETGTLLAVGFTARQAGRIVLCEGVAAAAAGALPGLLLGVAYSWALISGLGSVWSDAVAGAALELHLNGTTLLLGGLAAVALALPVIWITQSCQARSSIPALLAGARKLEPSPSRASPGRNGFLVAAASALGAGAFILHAALWQGDGGPGTASFFGAGALLLLGTMALVHGLLGRQASVAAGAAFSLASLALRNTARKRGRSLAVVAVLACGTFLVFAVGSNRTILQDDLDDPASGTGGFMLCGETSLPVLHRPDTRKGRAELGLKEEAFPGTEVVNLRVREGDDASCLNLNRAQHPRLLGVDPADLLAGKRFTFLERLDDRARDNPWSLLDLDCPDGAVPAVADQATIVWGLEKKVGDTIDYRDEKGRAFKVKLVGSLKNSILQGSLLISEEQFMDRFPSEEGYRLFLIDAPGDRHGDVRAAWKRAGRNKGLQVTTAADRLAAFCAVQNCYLSLFHVLGGLGLLLGGAGLAVILLRNVVERRSELALLHAVGYSDSCLARLLFLEHGRLFAAGICSGVFAAGVAVWPVLRTLGNEVPWFSLGITVAVIVAGGFISLWAAARHSATKEYVHALRNE